ncbi:MAG: Bug family tripartite tricarboxylate transporter substrate binding protein [Lautropia sp.]
MNNFARHVLGAATRLVAVAAVLLPLAPLEAAAADRFPSRSVELVVAYPAGGSADAVSRVIAEQLAKIWGSPVVVQNKPGAAGQLGFSAIANAKPDGYTIGLVPAAFMHLPAIKSSLPFDVLKDFDFITRVVEMPFAMVVSSKHPARSVAQFIELAKKRAAGQNYGTFGDGTSNHVLGVQFSRETGLKAANVSYPGAPPMLTDLIAGNIDFGFDLVVTSLPLIKDGRLAPLFVTSASRDETLPNTPTAAEVGLPGMQYATWFGFMAPRGVPADVLSALNKAIVAAANDSEVKAKLQQRGMAVKTESPEAFRSFVTDYKEQIRKIVQSSAN